MAKISETEEKLTHKKIMWKPFFDALVAEGIITQPEMTRKVTIEAQVGQMVTVTVEQFTDGTFMKGIVQAHRDEEAIVK